MPTYEYACSDCGHEFEAFQAFSEDALTNCPECRGEIRKVYSNVGVVFKGSGFYKTDSRKTASTTTPTPAPAAVATPTATTKKESAS